MQVRAARPGELAELSALALRSKGHWGYDAAFLEACRAELTITADRLRREVIRVAELARDDPSNRRRIARIGGFYALGFDATPPDQVGRVAGDHPRGGELLDLFVDTDLVGTGVGRALWHDLLAQARTAGLVRLRIEADPHAEAWYRRRGAVRVGEAPSGSIPGRSLPLLELALAAG